MGASRQESQVEWGKTPEGSEVDRCPKADHHRFLGKESIWDQSSLTMHNRMCRTPRSEPENSHQDREAPGDAPPDRTMEEWVMTWAEEITAAPEVVNPDTRTDDLIGQLQAWLI
jgi:hypothetical protein